MKEQIITFETGELAKEKGFNCKIRSAFSGIGHHVSFHKNNFDWNDGVEYVSAPTQSLLQKWLREKHKLFVWVEPDEINKKSMCTYFIQSMDESIVINEFSEPRFKTWIMANKTYEEALEKGLLEALKLIK